MQFIPNKYLVILIFAGLLSAQTADHRFDVIPSTDDSATGKVCFHEKIANGSNTICLTVPASLSVDTDIDLGNLDSGGWMRTGTVLHPANLADNVSIGNTSNIADLYIRDENSTAGSRITNLVIRGGQDQGFSPHMTLQNTSGGDLAYLGETIAFVEGAGDQPAVLWRNGIRLSRSLNKCIGWVNAPTVWSGADDVQICGGANEIKLTNGSTGTSGISAGFGNFSAVGGTWDNYVRARKFEFVDSGGGAPGTEGAWDAWADVTNLGVTSAFRLRDNAGDVVLRLVRAASGFASDSAYLDMNLVPVVNLERDLGSSSLRWQKVWAHDASLTGTTGVDLLTVTGNVGMVHGQTITFSDGIFNRMEITSTSITTRNGAGAQLFNLNSAGAITVTGCTGCGSGSLFTDGGATTYLTATGDNLCIGCTSTAAKARIQGSSGVELSHAAIFDSFIGEKLRFYRDGSGDFGVSIAASTMLIHADDPGSTIQLGRKDTGGAFTNWASFGSTTSQISGSLSVTGNVGMAHGQTLTFSDGIFNRMEVTSTSVTMRNGAGAQLFSINSSGAIALASSMSVSGGLFIDGSRNATLATITPPANNTYDWGSTSVRPRKIHTVDLDVSGTCTGCGVGSSLFTDGGATTYLTATGDNLCVGCTSTAYKMQISGSVRLIGTSLLDALNLNGNMGMLHGQTITFSDGIFNRMEVTSTSITTRNGGGTQLFNVSSAGVVTATGYTYNGTTGLTGAYNVGACTMTFQGGILTATTC